MSFAPDISFVLREGLTEITRLTPVSGGFRVTTQCMYPSNGLVQVTVRGGAQTIMASDEGGALGEALSAGIPKRRDSALMHLVKDQGLLIEHGIIFTPRMPLEAAPLAVLLVANASQEVARWLYDNTKLKRPRNFKALLAEFLNRRFRDQVSHDATIVGQSTKTHKFANIVSFGDGRRLIVDPVSNEPGSVNARVVANLDVKAIGDPLLYQRIVYDEEEQWKTSDLNLLQVGGTVVRFSQSAEVIERIAARV